MARIWTRVCKWNEEKLLSLFARLFQQLLEVPILLVIWFVQISFMIRWFAVMCKDRIIWQLHSCDKYYKTYFGQTNQKNQIILDIPR